MNLAGMGLEVLDGSFPSIGRIALKALSGMPSALRERLVFGGLKRQAALQHLLGGPRALSVRYTRGPLAGMSFGCESSEKYFIVGADYENDLLPIVRAAIKPTDVIYDIGANAGYWSLAFARLCPQGTVYAFEPSPINYARLEANTAAIPNISRIRAAVSEAAGTVRFSERGSVSGIWSDGEVEVERVRLDDCNLPVPNFLKVDIEGHAGSALAGATGLLRRGKPLILCEIHDADEEAAFGRVLGALEYRFEEIERRRTSPFHVLARAR